MSHLEELCDVPAGMHKHMCQVLRPGPKLVLAGGDITGFLTLQRGEVEAAHMISEGFAAEGQVTKAAEGAGGLGVSSGHHLHNLDSVSLLLWLLLKLLGLHFLWCAQAEVGAPLRLLLLLLW